MTERVVVFEFPETNDDVIITALSDQVVEAVKTKMVALVVPVRYRHWHARLIFGDWVQGTFFAEKNIRTVFGTAFPHVIIEQMLQIPLTQSWHPIDSLFSLQVQFMTDVELSVIKGKLETALAIAAEKDG